MEKKPSDFLSYSATKHLLELAKHPFDLTKPGALSKERVDQFKVKGAGLKLLYATERITVEVMKYLYALADEAKVLSWMEKMQSGEMINSSEKRSVLHTAMRDFFDKPNQGEKAKEAAALGAIEREKLKKFIDETAEFTDLVLVGIGGSDLGPESLYYALEYLRIKGRRAHFISNVDPDDCAHVLKDLDLNKTIVVVISKTGTTLETVTNEEMVRSYFKRAKVDEKSHFVSVTGKGSPLDDNKRYRQSFYMWDFIGGRYCSTSMAGGLLLAFTYGFDTYIELLRGAHAMDLNALESDYSKNLPLNLALLSLWNHNFLNSPTTAIIPYSRALYRFPAHIQQLDMESNGKHIDREGRRVDFQTGPIIWGEPGTNAQHSFFQLIHQGTAIVPLEIIGFKKSQYGQDEFNSQQKLLSNLFAQSIALATGQKNDNPNKGFEGNRPSLIILGEQLTPFTMGSLFALYEHKVVFQGFIYGINSFDQEGVELGKKLALQVLGLFSKKDPENAPAATAFIEQLDG